MNYNPYTPPKARVEDVLPPQVGKTRPRQIVIAMQLAAVNFVLGMVTFALSWQYFSKLQTSGQMITHQLLGLALLTWIYYKIYMGRNWARITQLVLVILGALVMGLPPAMHVLTAAPLIAKSSMVISLGVNIAVLWLLFLSPGRIWFQKPPGKVVA
jgi:amino acid transporter